MCLGAVQEERDGHIREVPGDNYEQNGLPPGRCPASKIRHYFSVDLSSDYDCNLPAGAPYSKRPHYLLVTGPGAIGGGAFPQVSLAGFQSGTDASGHSRTPVTLPRTATTASNRAPPAHTLTGNEKSCVLPSAYATLNRTGNGIDVNRRKTTLARFCPSELCIVTLSIPMSRTSVV